MFRRVPETVQDSTMTTRNLILVLGDQLSTQCAALASGDPARDQIVMVEVNEEATYVKHHKKKIAFIFSAMRHFAEALKKEGWPVHYVRIDEDGNTGSFGGEIERAIDLFDPESICVTEPGEWRVRKDMDGWAKRFSRPVEILEDDRFICSHTEFQDWAEDRKQYRMEYFYREMRRKTGLLMDGDEPVGGKWNYDADNRKPAKADLFMPQPRKAKQSKITKDVLAAVETHFGDHFGALEPFWFAVTKADAEAALDAFIEHALPNFGDYQDAMLEGEAFLYHAVVSLYINVGLLDPLETCQRVETAYYNEEAPLNAAEGFIRQIIGWREYVRGIYWLKMPDYAELNFLEADRALPEFYWSGDTDMACLRAAITQTRDEAYAHHIQRLMVTGNFALLIGVKPEEIHEWYLAVYADAYEWVELPNTLGMSQFADGGILGSKPYAASGAYINRMSDHCEGCVYDVKTKFGEGACPFNSLYWDFLMRNADTLKANPRMRQIYANWGRMSEDKQQAYLSSAANFLDSL